MEYPSYGLYTSAKISDHSMQTASESVYDFLVKTFQLRPENIIIFGRSMGSGPATYLASARPCSAFFLFTPFRSIKGVAKEHVGCLACCAPNYFPNEDLIQQITVPTFIVHGKSDEVISVENAKVLFDKSGSAQKVILTPEMMSHNSFDLRLDLIEPSVKFLRDNRLLPPIYIVHTNTINTSLFNAHRSKNLHGQELGHVVTNRDNDLPSDIEEYKLTKK